MSETTTEAASRADLTRRGFLGLTATGGAALTLAACGGSSGPPGASNAKDSGGGGKTYNGPPVTLAFWNGFTGGDGDFIRKIIKEFNDSAHNITIKMNVYEWASFYAKLPGAVASGKAPDVAVLHLDQLATNAARNVLSPIDEVASALGLDASQYTSQVVWDGGEYKGKRYGIPLDMHPLGMYYNKALLTKAGLDPEKPPETKDDYEHALEALKGKGIKGHWMAPFLFTGSFQFESILWQFGGDLFDKDVTKATFDSDAGVQALTWMRSLVDKGYSPPDVAQDADFIAFTNGKNAFNWNGIWQVNALKATKLDWAAAPVPKIGGGTGVWGNSHQFVIPRSSKVDKNKSDAARFFINWIEQRAAEWMKSAKIPPLKKTRDSKAFTSQTDLIPFAQESSYIHFVPPVAGIADATAMVDKAVNLGVLGKAKPADALKTAAAQATKIIQDNKKKYGA